MELPLAEPDAVQLGGDRLRERLRRGAASLAERGRKLVDLRLRLLERRLRLGLPGRPRPRAIRARPAPPPRAPGLLIRGAAEAALGGGDPVELAFEVLEASRLRLESGEERPQLGGGLA